jgi:hypothetical protein
MRLILRYPKQIAVSWRNIAITLFDWGRESTLWKGSYEFLQTGRGLFFTQRILSSRRGRAICPAACPTDKRNPLRRSPFAESLGAGWNGRLSSMRERFWLDTRNSRQACDPSHRHPQSSAQIPARSQKVAYRGPGGIVRDHWQRRRRSERKCDFRPEGTGSCRCERFGAVALSAIPSEQ